MPQRELPVASFHAGAAPLKEIGTLPGLAFQIGLQIAGERSSRNVSGEDIYRKISAFFDLPRRV